MVSKEAASGLVFFWSRLKFLFNKRPRTYIVPTLFGLGFGLIALVLFLFAMGFANNLIYIFVFFLISVALVGAHFTNKNIDHLRVTFGTESRYFANEDSELVLSVKNSAAAEALDVLFFVAKSQDRTVMVQLSGKSEARAKVVWRPRQRGWMRRPRVIVQSTFPFGLLRAWQVLESDEQVMVFPQRAGEAAFPLESREKNENSNVGLFRDHRLFQSSDSVLRIDWRASARRQQLLVKTYEEQKNSSLHFSWEQTAFLGDTEKRLSQLCLWVDEAEKKGHRYSLSIGSQEVARGAGTIQWRKCLEILAQIEFSEVELL